MPTLALEIHDAGLVATGEAGAVTGASPGYALYDGGALTTGLAAWKRAREKPRWVHHRFWQDLSSEPVGRPFPRDSSLADLAHAHLSQVWAPLAERAESVLLAVPGSFSPTQLALLLGIARACGMPVSGMVDAAVASAAGGLRGEPKLLHLDLHLHRSVLTELAVSLPPARAETSTARLVRRRLEIADGTGLVALQDAWAHRIAELFVHATRFDPMHSAASEQALYRRLPGWLERLRHEEIVEVTLGPPGRERSIELTRPDVVAAADSHYDHLLNLVLSLKRAGEGVTLLMSHHAAELPGLEPRLAELRGVTTAPLPPGAAAAGALRLESEIRAAAGSGDAAGEALPFLTRVSYEPLATALSPGHQASAPAAEEADAARIPEAGGRPPTHLLHGDLAYPITGEPFVLGVAIGGARGLELSGQTAAISRIHLSISRQGGRVLVDDHSTYGSFLNGVRIAGRAALAAGDRLRLGTPGIEVRLIAVETDRLHPSGVT